MKKIWSIFLSFVLIGSLTACSSGENTEGTGEGGTSNQGSIYYLNFKPEVADVYKQIAEDYQKETGITLNVVTAASGTYEQTLKSEIAKADAPVLFQINGPKGYASWKDYCKDLKDAEIYQHLTDKNLAITSGDGVYGIPYVVEGYGIIYNDAILQKYFNLPDKGTSFTSMDEIRNFDSLKELVEDMTAKKEELGIEGVFASTSMTPGDDWRWQTHLANIPIYYEFEERGIDLTSEETGEITFEYSENFKNIFDLYLNNSLTEKGLLGSKSTDDSMAEFALGRCAMVQNGNWAWSQINGVQGNVVNAEDVKYLPIYTGIAGEEDQGLCIGTENFLAINSQVSEEKQKLAEDFVYWLYSSDTGKNYVTHELGFISPFDTFTEDEVPEDPLAKEVLKWMQDESVTNIPWDFTVFPSQTFKDNFGSALLEYAQGNKTWDEVKTLVVEDWKKESEASAQSE